MKAKKGLKHDMLIYLYPFCKSSSIFLLYKSSLKSLSDWYEKSVMSAQILEVSLLLIGVGTVLRLANVVCSMVK